MRAWEPLRGDNGKIIESSKAFEAFKSYRDLGPSRSLAKASSVFYGDEGYHEGTKVVPRRIKTWSANFDCFSRARAHDDWLEMIKQDAIEKLEVERATEMAARRGRIRDNLLEAAEVMSLQAAGMAKWPLSRKETVEVDEKGRPTVVKVYPARWSKRTVLDLVTAVSRVLEDQEVIERIEELEAIVANQQGGRYGGV